MTTSSGEVDRLSRRPGNVDVSSSDRLTLLNPALFVARWLQVRPPCGAAKGAPGTAFWSLVGAANEICMPGKSTIVQ